MDKNMMKGFIIGFMVITIGACSNLGNLIPNKFDNVEYGSLVRLGVITENAKKCDGSLVMSAWGESAFLEKYGKYTIDETNQKIYVKINDLVEELRDEKTQLQHIVASNGAISELRKFYPFLEQK